MRYSVLSINEWSNMNADDDYYSPYFNPKFIQVVEKCYKVKAVIYIIYQQEIVILCTVLYVKFNSIVHPSPYFYSAIWENSNSNLIKQKAYNLLIIELCSKYSNIHFQFPPEITDIRPFLISGFRPRVNYTYYNNLKNLYINSKLLSRNRKAIESGIIFNWEFNKEIIEQNVRFLYKMGYRESYVKSIHCMFSNLYDEGIVIGVAAKINNVIIASAIILHDKKNKIAMNLFVTSEKKYYDTGLHSALYINIFHKLKQDGYIINDLYGSNTLGIGNFKGNFNGELTVFYELKFNKLRLKIINIMIKIKKILGNA